MKKGILLFLLVLMALLVSACGGSETEGDAVSEDGNLTVGETGLYKTESGDFEVTINSITYATGEANEQPLRGKYIVANATVTSKSSEVVDVHDLLAFKIYIDDIVNWSNVSYSKELSFASTISGELNEGDSVTGDIIFDTRESDTYTIILGGKIEPNKLEWVIPATEIK